MKTILLSGAIGFILAFAVVFLFRKLNASKDTERKIFDIHSTVEKFRSVGELVVFKIVTKEIITASDHWFGETGKKYFQWLASNKKMAMIFQFDISFMYNLHSPEFTVKDLGNNRYRLKMPKCLYDSHIKDISFYDEQGAKFLPWLLPHLLTSALSNGFNEETKNKLIGEAKSQAAKMANDLVKRMQSEVQKSAVQTLELLASGFGASKIIVDFSDAELVQAKVDYVTAE